MSRLLASLSLLVGALAGAAASAWPLLPLPASVTPAPYSGGQAVVCLDRAILRSLKATKSNVIASTWPSFRKAWKRKQTSAAGKWPHREVPDAGERSRVSKIVFKIANPNAPLDSTTNESYRLSIAPGAITVEAPTAYGARHALMTLLQMVVQSDSVAPCGKGRVPLPAAIIDDAPRFSHRGLMVDTSRHYIPLDQLKRQIDSMAYVKLNVFHWHIVDATSFPFVAPSHPELASRGAYSAQEVYTAKQVAGLVAHARDRGVRVIMEIDTPGHFYIWGKAYPQYVMCNSLEYQIGVYCPEPPCGFMRTDNPGAVALVEDVLKDAISLTIDNFLHIGGDEVTPTCWGSPQAAEAAFQAYSTRIGQFVTSQGRDIIAWADSVLKYGASLPQANTVLQGWEGVTDAGGNLISSQVIEAVHMGYRAIDAVYVNSYLDCGTGNWLTGGRSWCDPFKSWNMVYTSEPTTLVPPNNQGLVVGGEVALWTEAIGPANIESRAWMQAAAAAERYWAPRSTRDVVSAQRRLRKVQLALESIYGIGPTPMQPEYCYPVDPDMGVRNCDAGYSTWLAVAIPLCSSGTTAALSFSNSVTGHVPPEGTTASVCVTADAKFNITITATDADIWSPYTTCNSVVADADTLGVVIATGMTEPTEYIDIAVGPSTGGVAIAKVTNPTGMQATARMPIDCIAAAGQGVSWAATIAASSWTVSLELPFAFVSQSLGGSASYGTGPALIDRLFRVNLYRINVETGKPVGSYPTGWFPSAPGLGFSSYLPTFAYPASFDQTTYLGEWIVPEP